MNITATNDCVKRGDSVTIHFSTPDKPIGHARCLYTGTQNGKHYFLSDRFFETYIVDLASNTIINMRMPQKVYKIDNSTGWASQLPQ